MPPPPPFFKYTYSVLTFERTDYIAFYSHWPGGIQKFVNLIWLYQFIVPVDLYIELQFKSRWFIQKYYQFSYRKIYRKNGQWNYSGILLSSETIWQWMIMLAIPKRKCYPYTLFNWTRSGKCTIIILRYENQYWYWEDTSIRMY